MKEARLIGKSQLNSVPDEVFDLWSCPYCNRLFNALPKLRNKKIKCGDCKKEIYLKNEVVIG